MNKGITKFEDLHCWQKSRELNRKIFEVCDQEGIKSDFVMQNQIKRAPLSIMNNIAEGFGRFGKADFIRFLNFATSSALEVRSMLYVMLDRDYIGEEKFNELYRLSLEQNNYTLGLIRYLNKKGLHLNTLTHRTRKH